MTTTEANRRRVPSGGPAARLRVLHIGKYYPPHMGGIETHLETLCQELKGEVDQRVLVASDDRDTTVESVDGVEVVRAGTAFHLTSQPITPGLTRLIRESHADIVHLHLPNPAAVIAYFASGHRGKLVVSYHSDIVRQRLLGGAFGPILRRLLHRASAIVVASPNYVASSSALAAFRDKCAVIPYGISLGSFGSADPGEVRRIRDEYGPRLVLGVGRLVYYKGFEHLVDAMRQVDGRLLVIGDGPRRAELEARARSGGVGERVTFLGQVRDIRPYYHAAALFVLASVARSEAFGIVQLEAMAAGIPVVNTGLDSGVPFVSRHGETGLTVPPADPAALADAINLMLGDEALRSRYGSAARDRAEREFSKEVMAARILQLYREAAAMRDGPRVARSAALGR